MSRRRWVPFALFLLVGIPGLVAAVLGWHALGTVPTVTLVDLKVLDPTVRNQDGSHACCEVELHCPAGSGCLAVIAVQDGKEAPPSEAWAHCPPDGSMDERGKPYEFWYATVDAEGPVRFPVTVHVAHCPESLPWAEHLPFLRRHWRMTVAGPGKHPPDLRPAPPW